MVSRRDRSEHQEEARASGGGERASGGGESIRRRREHQEEERAWSPLEPGPWAWPRGAGGLIFPEPCFRTGPRGNDANIAGLCGVARSGS